MKKLSIAIMTLWLFAGCALKEAPPLKLFTLDAGHVSAVKSSPYRGKIVKVSYPQSMKEGLSDKMAFSYSSSDRGYYQNAKWSNDLGKLLQGNLIEVLQKSRLFKAVLPYASTADEDLRIESIVYDFSHRVRGETSYAVVSIGFNLIDAKSGKLLKHKHFFYKETTPTYDASGYVQASNRAMHRLAHDLTVWLR